MNKITLSKWFALVFLLTIFSKFTFAEQQSSITQYGITWNFDGQHECGQFITGDWWVVGPVTVVSVSPTPTSTRNGSVLNPAPGVGAGYDSRMYSYDADLQVNYPITISGISSLVSTVSNPDVGGCTTISGKTGWVSRWGICETGITKSMAVLTIVSAPVPNGTFRPSFIGSNHKELINVSEIDYNVLPHLPPPATTPDIDDVIPLVERPWMDHFNGWITQKNFAIDNAKGYGRDMSNDITEIAACLMLDIPELELLAQLMVQRGIDLYGGIQNGANWPADGGHGSGRKWPILFAGKVLNHQGMLNVGNDFGPTTFGEDCQTYYTSTGEPWWGVRHCTDSSRDDQALDSYRVCCTSRTWVGQMLTAMMLGLRDEWNHEAYFDYVDRWINEGGDYGGNTTVFIQEMWTTYRNNLPVEIPHSGGGAPDTEAPTAPANLVANGVTGSVINLSWNEATDNVRVTSYYLYKDDVLEQTINATLTSASFVELSCNTTYSFTVKARDAAGNLSVASAPLSVTTTSVCDPVNLALNKSILVSSEDAPTPGTYLIDGNTSDGSRWSASGFPQWAEIDLGADYDLSQIELYTYQSRAYQYTIEAKADGGSYTTIVNRSSNTQTSQPIADLVTVNARYVKITVTGAAGYTGTWVSLNELKIFDNGGTPPVIVDVTSVSVNPTIASLDVDETIDLTETVEPSNATNKNVSWTSSNSSIASVNSDGLVTAVSAGNCTITVTTEDGGYTATCAATVNDAPPPVGGEYYCDPVNGSMSNNGSQSSPWASLEAVFTAGKSFVAGDNIYLLTGHHGSPVISGNNASDVNILPASGQQPTLRCLTFNSASHWHLNNITISPSTASSYVKATELIIIDVNSSYISLNDCDIYSMSSPWTTASGWLTNVCNGFHISGHHNTFTNNHIKNIKFGYRLSPTANYNTIQNNIIENIAADGIQAVASYNVFENNIIRNCYDIDDNHDDGIQIYTIGTDGSVGTGNSVGVVIRNNIIMSYTDPNQPLKGVFQGIGCFDGTYTDWVVENNLIVTNTWHGISLYGSVNCKIVNNTVIAPDGASPSATWIKVTAHKNGTPAIGNIVSNNIANDIACDAGAALEENNDEVSAAEYTTYFADFTIRDFQLKTGSPAIDNGNSNNAPSTDLLGNSRPNGTAYDIGCYEYSGVTVSVTDVTLFPETLTIEIGESSMLTATVEPSNATNKNVNWTSSNSSIATVNPSGLVSAVSQGIATITVTTVDGGFTANCVVAVTPSTIGLPSPWTNGDVGAVGATGSVTYASGTFTVEGSGANIWNSADEFHFVYQQISDDATITARLNSLEQVHAWTKGGLMMRENLNENSINANVFMAPIASNGSKFSYRSVAGATSSEFDGPDVTAPYWLRLERSGNSFTGSVSADGVTWTTIGSTTINMSATFYVGLSVTAITDGSLATASFDNVSVQSSSTIAVTSVSVDQASLTLEIGQSSDLTETVSPSNATDKTVQWSSSNSAIASVDANGLVTALTSGNATITVTTNDGDFTENCAVTVNAPINNVPTINTLSDVTLLDNAGQQTINLSGISDGDGNTQTVSVSAVSSDINVVNNAAVNYTSGNATGTLTFTPVTAGTATITVTVADDGGTLNGGENTKVISFVVTVNPSCPGISSVALNLTSGTLDVAQTEQLIETVLPVCATDKSVVWSSNNPSVATVDANGFVTAVGSGTATITVTTNDGGYTASYNVTVNSLPVISNLALNKPIAVSAYQDDTWGYKPGENLVDGDVSDDARWSAGGFPQWAEIDLAQTYELSSINLYPYQNRAYQYIIEARTESGSYSTIVNRSSNTVGADVLSDDVSGIARYVKITVSGLSGSSSTWVSLSELEVMGQELTTTPVDGITISLSSLSLDAGQSIDLEETVTPANATDRLVIWSSSNELVATVAPDGLVNAIDEGTATITVTTNDGGYTASCLVAVSIPVTGVTLSQTSLNLEQDDTAVLTAIVSPTNASDNSVIWSSNNLAVASIDGNGQVTAIAEGTAIIEVTTNDGSFTDQCMITVTAPAIVTGSITREYWTNISGNFIPDLTGNANYPNNPSGSDELTSLEAVDWENPTITSGLDDNYGQRIRGYLIPETTGEYTFWIASDNCSNLYISTDEDPANMTRIAYVEGSTPQYDWDKYSTQKSATISLVAGEAYYVEILHKDGCCGDNLAVGWAKPGESTTAPSEIVPGDVLTPYFSASKSSKTIKQNNIQSNRVISICPNVLSEGDFKISLSGYKKSRNIEIMIFDMSGKKVYDNSSVTFDSKGFATIILSVGDIKQKGLFLVVVADGMSIQQRKFVIY